MDSTKIIEAAFYDELEKIGASMTRFKVPKSRAGRRSISASNFLKKEKDGTLFKKHGFVASYLDGGYDQGATKPPKKKGDVPTRDDSSLTTREDGRENAVNVNGPATLLSDIGATQ